MYWIEWSVGKIINFHTLCYKSNRWSHPRVDFLFTEQHCCWS